MPKKWKYKWGKYQRARAKKLGLKDELNYHEWGKIVQAHMYRCAYCLRLPEYLTQDHVIPLSKGGTHTPDNVIPACVECNRSKADKDPLEFKPLITIKT